MIHPQTGIGILEVGHFYVITVGHFYVVIPIWLGRKLAHEIDCDRLNRVAAKIVKGLYYLVKAEPTPDGYEAGAVILDLSRPEIIENVKHIYSSMYKNGAKYIGNKDVFRYYYTDIKDDPCAMVWLMAFFNRFLFLGTIATAGKIEELKKQSMERKIVFS